ncbi:MAG: hypothetical protein BWY91_01620 [bacterium ADurb.BinA028]|nr:MAG: hypothetical protein BWY91_01620 [bacterium ADurb.BinA028]
MRLHIGHFHADRQTRYSGIQTRKRVRHHHIKQRHVARVRNTNRVRDHVANAVIRQRRARLNHRQTGILLRRHRRIVIVTHGLAIRTFTGSRSRIQNLARIHIRLRHHIGPCICLRGARRKRRYRRIQVRQRINHGNIRKGHIARIGHRHRVRNQIARNGIRLRGRRLGHRQAGGLLRGHRRVVFITHRVAVRGFTRRQHRIHHAARIHVRLRYRIGLRIGRRYAGRKAQKRLGKARQRVRHHYVCKRYVARVRHRHSVGNHITRNGIRRRIGRLNHGQARTLDRRHRRVVRVRRHRIPAAVGTCRHRRVDYPARVHVGLCHRVTARARKTFQRQQARGRAGTIHQRYPVVVHRKRRVQRHVAVVHHKVGVCNGLAHGAVGGNRSALHQRKRRTRNRAHHRLVVIIHHRRPVRGFARHHSRIHEPARVYIRLRHRVTRRERRRIRCARSKAQYRPARYDSHRITHHQVVQRHVARVRHRQRIRQYVAHGRVTRLVRRLLHHNRRRLLERRRLRVARRFRLVAVRRARVHNLARIQVRLCHRVGARQHARAAGRHTGAIRARGRQHRVAHHDVIQRHVPRVRHRYRIGQGAANLYRARSKAQRLGNAQRRIRFRGRCRVVLVT